MDQKNNIKETLDILNTLNEYLLSITEDMLLSIDPKDNQSIESGLQSISQFNNSLSEFIGASVKIEAQIKKYFSINPEEDDIVKESSNNNKNKRIIKELDKTEFYSLDENFTYKRPFGFVLGDSVYKGIKTWKSLYLQVLRELRGQYPEKILKLTEEEKFITNRGNALFAKNDQGLRIAEELFSGFFVEVNLSANSIRDNIINLLDYFGVDSAEFKISLRENRDA